MTSDRIEPVWGLVANVVDRRFSGPEGEIRSGTKHFVPGAKVYYHRAYWGMGADQVKVTGRHRGSKKLVSVVMARRHLHNWRANMIYKPSVLERLASDWCEIANGTRGRDPETEARELAARFNEASHYATFDRPREMVDGLVRQWRQEGRDGLDVLDGFSADRWIVLYEGITPVGVGISDYSRSYQWWVLPDHQHGWEQTLKPALERSLPVGEGSPKLEYESSLSTSDLDDLAALMVDQFDKLHTLAFAPTISAAEDPLVTFSLPLLRSRFINWPEDLSGFEHEILTGWVDGRSARDLAERLSVHEGAVSRGFDLIRTEGFSLAGTALRLMHVRHGHDVEEKEAVGAVLGRTRLDLGVNSWDSCSLLRTRFRLPFGHVVFERVAASALAAEFQSTIRSGTKEHFLDFALGQVSELWDRGLLSPAESAGDDGGRAALVVGAR